MTKYQLYICKVCYKDHGFFCEAEADSENPKDDDLYCMYPGKLPLWTKSKIPIRYNPPPKEEL